MYLHHAVIHLFAASSESRCNSRCKCVCSKFNLKVKLLQLPTAREGNVFTPVCLFTGSLWTDTPQTGTSPRKRPPLTEAPCTETTLKGTWNQTGSDNIHPPVLASSGGHCSGRYASHWNAFLLISRIICIIVSSLSLFFSVLTVQPRTHPTSV